MKLNYHCQLMSCYQSVVFILPPPVWVETAEKKVLDVRKKNKLYTSAQCRWFVIVSMELNSA